MAKATKSAAHYGKGMKSAHCGICRHFIRPDACEKVEGEIGASMWCKFFKKAAKPTRMYAAAAMLAVTLFVSPAFAQHRTMMLRAVNPSVAPQMSEQWSGALKHNVLSKRRKVKMRLI